MISANGSSADGMATKRVTERGEEPVRERVVATRAESREERRGDRRRRHRLVDCVLHRPPAFSRIFDEGLEARQLRVGGERARGELEEPGAHDAALVPEVRDAR